MNNKYIKKSVEIEAIQWNGNNTEEIINFIKLCTLTQGDNLIIPTLEGDIKASVGDYIIKGIKGEYYPCKPDIFELTYEKVYTLEEVKKEWEKNGYKWEENEIYIHITKRDRLLCVTKDICITKQDKQYCCYDEDEDYSCLNLTLQEHQLLTKTFKALGWFND